MHLHVKVKKKKKKIVRKKKKPKKLRKTGSPVTHSLMTRERERKESETEIKRGDALFLSATALRFYPMKVTF